MSASREYKVDVKRARFLSWLFCVTTAVLVSPAGSEVTSAPSDYQEVIVDSTRYPRVVLLNEADCDLKLLGASGTKLDNFLVDMAIVAILAYPDLRKKGWLNLEQVAALNQLYSPRSDDDVHPIRLKFYVASDDTVLAFSITSVAFDYFDDPVLSHRVVAVGSFVRGGKKRLVKRPGPSTRRRKVFSSHSVRFPLYHKNDVMNAFLFVDRIRYTSGRIWKSAFDRHEARIDSLLRRNQEDESP